MISKFQATLEDFLEFTIGGGWAVRDQDPDCQKCQKINKDLEKLYADLLKIHAILREKSKNWQ